MLKILKELLAIFKICLIQKEYLFFHKRIRYALAIPEETDGQETSKAIRYILIFRIMVSREKESQYGLLIM